MSNDPVAMWAGRVRVYQRPDRTDPVKLAEARRNLSEARVERAILEAMAASPPMTMEQRQRLADLLTAPSLLNRVIEVLDCPTCATAPDFRGIWRHSPSCPMGNGRAVGLRQPTTTKEETP